MNLEPLKPGDDSSAIEEVPALDDLDGDQADKEAGEYVQSEADVHPDGISSTPDDFEFPEVSND